MNTTQDKKNMSPNAVRSATPTMENSYESINNNSRKYAITVEPLKLSSCGWFSKFSSANTLQKKTRTDYILAMLRSHKVTPSDTPGFSHKVFPMPQ